MASFNVAWERQHRALSAVGKTHPVIGDALSVLESSIGKREVMPARMGHKIGRAYELLRSANPSIHPFAPEVVAAALLPRRFEIEDLHGREVSKAHSAANEILDNYHRGLHGLGGFKGYKSNVSQGTVAGIRAAIKDPRAIMLMVNDFRRHLEEEANPRTQQRMARNALSFWAPLAETMSWNIAAEIEDTAFQILHPREFAEVSRAIEHSRDSEHATELVGHVRRIVRETGEPAITQWRVKGVYRIFRTYEKSLEAAKRQAGTCQKILATPLRFNAAKVLSESEREKLGVGGRGQWEILVGRLADLQSLPEQRRKSEEEQLRRIAEKIDHALAEAGRTNSERAAEKFLLRAEGNRRELFKRVEKTGAASETDAKTRTLKSTLEGIKDYLGVRVILIGNNPAAAIEVGNAVAQRLPVRLAGLQHWKERDRDFFAAPKDSGYRAYHVVFRGNIKKRRTRAEIQFTTRNAHLRNQVYAPHFVYKDELHPAQAEIGGELESLKRDLLRSVKAYELKSLGLGK